MKGRVIASDPAAMIDEVVSSPAGVVVMLLGCFYVLGHALLMAVPMHEALRATRGAAVAVARACGTSATICRL